jgi:hypothetical protein
MDVRVAGVKFFYQRLKKEVVKHQHLVIVPPFDLEIQLYLHLVVSYSCHHLVAHLMKMTCQLLVPHILILFWLDGSNQHVLHGLPQGFITNIIRILTCSFGDVGFIKFHIMCFFYQTDDTVEYSICFGL